jgi:hypothetical protein
LTGPLGAGALNGPPERTPVAVTHHRPDHESVRAAEDQPKREQAEGLRRPDSEPVTAWTTSERAFTGRFYGQESARTNDGGAQPLRAVRVPDQ